MQIAIKIKRIFHEADRSPYELVVCTSKLYNSVSTTSDKLPIICRKMFRKMMNVLSVTLHRSIQMSLIAKPLMLTTNKIKITEKIIFIADIIYN